METNQIQALQEQGQSVWLDYIRRALITSGEMQRLIDAGLTGMTSNPTIFEKAISGSSDYDTQMRSLIERGEGTREIIDALMIEDIQMAADLFRPVYDRTEGEDGFVSIELDPNLAHRTGETIAAAEALHPRLNRPNVMIKVPATREGIPAIEALTAAGISINITLIFSLEQYEKVAAAYIAGMEALLQRGGTPGPLRSVASLFVSRLDMVVDRLLEARIQTARAETERERLKGLLGKAGIANAKVVYQKFKEIFQGSAFASLRERRVPLQRLLFGSTSAKNPNYADVRYMEGLIGPNTINTVPQKTLNAFLDHGRVRPTLEEDLEGARGALASLSQLGIDLSQITEKLQEEGVQDFADSFKKLIDCVAEKGERLRRGGAVRFSEALGSEAGAADAQLRDLEQKRFAERLWRKDPSLWKEDPEAQKKIRNRLGWFTVTEPMMDHVDRIIAFARSIREAGFTDALLLGMGGSSLCAEVCRKSFGVATGFPDLKVLDSTDPATILDTEQSIDLRRTLFIVASKSGTTLEVQSLYRYFFEKLKTIQPDDAIGQHFIAITDPGTPLEKQAREDGFREIFLNPPDIGGRYSALSYFGLVPAALIGVDLVAFLDRAEEMVHSAASCVPAEENPGIRLGAILGALALRGRNKVTLIASPAIGSFGDWLEQLLAESTGKEGKGLVPVVGETLGAPAVYGDDRLFVSLRVDSDPRRDAQVDALRKSGHPVVEIGLRDLLDLGREFFRWEVATAVAGTILGVNPFDEPNVAESKEKTNALLEEFQKRGRLPSRGPALEVEGLQIHGETLAFSKGAPGDFLSLFLNQSQPSDYVAIMAYLERSERHDALLQQFRAMIRDRTHLATTVGYGPRFLHSTGQLHKGGPGEGRFLQITTEDRQALPIPGAPYGFSLLKQAQALGDFLSLTNRGRSILEIHLGREVASGLQKLIDLLGEQQAMKKAV